MITKRFFLTFIFFMLYYSIGIAQINRAFRVDTTSTPGVASKWRVDSAVSHASGGVSDTTILATQYRVDTIKLNRVPFWRYYSDTLNGRNYSNGIYQSKGTYLIPSDTSGKWTLIDSKLNKSNYYSDTSGARSYSNNLYQAKSIYLIPSDTNIFRTYSNLKYNAKIANGTDGFVWKMVDGVQGWSEDLTATGGGADSGIFATNKRLDDSLDNFARLGHHHEISTVNGLPDSLQQVRTLANSKQVAGTYLIPSDTIGTHNLADDISWQTSKLSRTDTITLSNRINAKAGYDSLQQVRTLANSKQVAGTYLIPSDTGNVRTFTNTQLALKLNVTDTLNRWLKQGDTSSLVHWADTNIVAKRNTATPGNYTNTNLTIGADGRITSASNGTGGTGSSYSPWNYHPAGYLSDTLFYIVHDLSVKAGLPIRFRGTDTTSYRYAIISSIKRGEVNDTLIISGAKYWANVDSMFVGPPEKVVKCDFGLAEYWSNYPVSGTTFDSLIYLHTGSEFKWGMSDAFMVQWAAVTRVIDVTAGTTLNLWKNAEVLMGTKGINMTSGNGTWMYSSAYYINTANYKVSCGDYIDLRIIRADTTPDARNLTVSIWFVLE